MHSKPLKTLPATPIIHYHFSQTAGTIFTILYTYSLLLMNTWNTYQSCIEACLKCAAVCDHCAVSCLAEEQVHDMRDCIRLDMECSAVCAATAKLMAMNSTRVAQWCTLCADVCDACAKECAKHDNDHCRMCAAQCKQCADECRKMNNH
jgi:hypothetical protein